MRPSRLIPILLLGALLPASAEAQTQTQRNAGLFSVTPARQLLVGHPPRDLDVTDVSNTTRQPLVVKVFPVILIQTVNGAVTFDESPRPLNQAKLLLTPTPDSFTLQPGETRKVKVRWNLLPGGARATNLGVVFQSIPPQKPGQPIGSIQRLLTLDLLRLPGHYRITGRFVQLRTEQGAPKQLVFTPRVQNTGELPSTPASTHFTIRDSGGKVVFSTHWQGDVILPGAQRDFPVTVKKILPKGDYTATALAHFGTSHMRITKPFTLAGPNQLPTPRVSVDELHGSATLGKDDAQATARMRSVGTAPASTSVKFELFKIAGAGASGKALATKKFRYSGLAPGSAKQLRVPYGKLEAGTYRVVVTYRDTPETLKQVSTVFQPTKEKSFWDRHKGLILALLVVLGILLLLLLLLWLLRRQRRLRRELEEARSQQAAAPPAAAPPAAPAAAPQAPPAAPAGAVNLNTASVEELQSLPGVGPKAAQRIIEHREEYGSFASVEALGEVEGFSDKRLEALRGLVDV